MNQSGLKRVLTVNGVFSGVSGLLLVAMAGSLTTVFDVGSLWLFRGIGLGLILFAADLIVESRKTEIGRGKALYFSISDFGWVAGSLLLLFIAPLPRDGRLLIGAVMLPVLIFGIVQWRCIGSRPVERSA